MTVEEKQEQHKKLECRCKNRISTLKKLCDGVLNDLCATGKLCESCEKAKLKKTIL